MTIRSEVAFPDRLVVKRNAEAMAENFQCEFNGLEAIAEADSIRVPTPYRTGIVGQHAYLVMEFLEEDRTNTRERFERFGSQLAKLPVGLEADCGHEVEIFVEP
ncbi:MAG: fructosamine kinase family protein, partial [Chloroflexota bacterium]